MYRPGVTIADMEKEMIVDSIRFHGGNKTKAALSLGITTKTIYNKMEAYGIPLKAEEREASEQAGSKAAAAACVESDAGFTPQLAVPLRERQKIQSVSSDRHSSDARIANARNKKN